MVPALGSVDRAAEEAAVGLGVALVEVPDATGRGAPDVLGESPPDPGPGAVVQAATPTRVRASGSGQDQRALQRRVTARPASRGCSSTRRAGPGPRRSARRARRRT